LEAYCGGGAEEGGVVVGLDCAMLCAVCIDSLFGVIGRNVVDECQNISDSCCVCDATVELNVWQVRMSITIE
jgi:hypothetical protein